MKISKQDKLRVVAESLVDMRTLNRFLKRQKIRDDSRERIEKAMKKLGVGR